MEIAWYVLAVLVFAAIIVAAIKMSQGALRALLDQLKAHEGEELPLYKPVAYTGGLTGLVALSLYSASISGSPGLNVFGVGLCISVAATFAGALAGFLFAIPRSNQKDDSPTHANRAYIPNSNLVEISDWLTKILVGVGLVQLGHLGKSAGRLVNSLGGSLGGAVRGRVMGAALVILYLAWGFILSYLWTTTRVLQEFQRISVKEKELEERLQKVEEVTNVESEDGANREGENQP
jgi:hypothetical protein